MNNSTRIADGLFCVVKLLHFDGHFHHFCEAKSVFGGSGVSERYTVFTSTLKLNLTGM